ncbi:MAG TPA: DUF255 domain-containing protein [candidate division Zixibacteria bacterium]|nr:DUF255 domain-containing protein [candidate division Zixibacteria bacterium]
MKLRLLLAFGIILLAGIFVIAQAGDEKEENAGVTYYGYEEGLEKAKQDSLHVVVFFETTWCTWCKKMDQTTLVDDDVVGLLKNNFVPVKVDGDKHRQLTREYGVRGYPSTWFLKYDGSRIAPIQGYWPAKDFYLLLKYISEYAYEKEQFKSWVEKEMNNKG